MTIENLSEFGKWKRSAAAVSTRYRIRHRLCMCCGAHPSGEWCATWGGVAPVEEAEPEWVTVIHEEYEAWLVATGQDYEAWRARAEEPPAVEEP